MSEPREILLQHLVAIEQIIGSICRRKGMDPADIEEFAAEVKFRLVEDDYAIIRAFQERSSFKTFMAAVIRNLLRDYQNHERGKWHDAAEALRLGEVAVELARIIQRDGRTIDEALTILMPKHPGITRDDLEKLATRLPARVPRKRVALEQASELKAPETDAALRNDTAVRISVLVNAFIARLSKEDQLIFRLRFECEMSVAQVSRSLHIEQQLLYRQLYKHFRDLREALERAGFSRADVEHLIGTDSTFLEFRFKNGGVRPSEKDESAVAARQEEEISS